MELYSEGKTYKLYSGNMLDLADVIEPNSISSIITDPPYELNFMAKTWDNSGIAFQKETWERCFKALKPGGYLLAFGGTRTYHRIACAIEDAGFEIRDTIMWVFGTGFAKSMNIAKSIDKHFGVQGEKIGERTVTPTSLGQSSGWHNCNIAKIGKQDIYALASDEAKQWDGWGTALKPAYEPIIVARKPCEGSCIDNVLKYGVGGINIGECRIPLEDNYVYKETTRKPRDNNVFTGETCGFDSVENHTASADPNGRFPSNIMLSYDDSDYDEVCGAMPNTGSGNDGIPSNYNDNGSASRYFYCAKASNKDRDEGMDGQDMKNIHPTVKPCDLMQYLVRLVTPKGGTILDPFNGSGSTGKAVMYENRERRADYQYIGIELTDEYLPIADARIKYVEQLPIQCSLFDLM